MWKNWGQIVKVSTFRKGGKVKEACTVGRTQSVVSIHSAAPVAACQYRQVFFYTSSVCVISNQCNLKIYMITFGLMQFGKDDTR
jgi:carbonic anhydrase